MIKFKPEIEKLIQQSILEELEALKLILPKYCEVKDQDSFFGILHNNLDFVARKMIVNVSHMGVEEFSPIKSDVGES